MFLHANQGSTLKVVRLPGTSEDPAPTSETQYTVHTCPIGQVIFQ